MQMVIDIPEEDYKGICHLKNEQLRMLPVEVAETLIRIANGAPIPDNATNGDVVKSIFTNTLDNFCERTTWEWNRWWNAPCQKGANE